MSNKQTALDSGFTNLSNMIADLGESFSPQRHDLQELMADTRAVLDEARHTHRQRMSA